MRDLADAQECVDNPEGYKDLQEDLCSKQNFFFLAKYIPDILGMGLPKGET
jgi:hypothetical protein